MKSLPLCALLATFLLLPALASAQSVSTIYTFPVTPTVQYPIGPVIQATDGSFYGTVAAGGANGTGEVYQLTTAGKVTAIYTFPAAGTTVPGFPQQLIQASNGAFYGVCASGGVHGKGVLFTLTAPKTGSTYGFQAIYNFAGNTDGDTPTSILDGGDGFLYGTTALGGTSRDGIVFKVKLGTTLVTKSARLDSFNGNDNGTGIAAGPLFKASDGNFYGLTSRAGTGKLGTIYKLTPAGVPTILHSFQGAAKKDGSSPDIRASLVAGPNDAANGAVLYGVTTTGGTYDKGTIFKLPLTGAQAGVESVVYSFGANTLPNPPVYPAGKLLLAEDGNLYGATSTDINNGSGTIFALGPDNTFSVVSTSPLLRAGPSLVQTGLIEGVDGLLYGTASNSSPTSSTPSDNCGVFVLNRGTSELTSPPGANATIGDAFRFQFTGTNQPTKFVSHPALPAGLSLSTAGLITGTPSKVVQAVVNISVTNAKGISTTPFAINVFPRPAPTITSALNAFGTLKKAFSYTLTASYTTAADAPVTYQVTGPDASTGLPPGLTYNASSHTITGTPTKDEEYTIKITVGNKVGTTTKLLLVTIFKTTPALGAEYAILHNFNDGTVVDDGSHPSFGSIIRDAASGLLYGTTSYGGGAGFQGTVYAMTTSGASASVVAPLNTAVGNNGYTPVGVIQGSDGSFYGVTTSGGSTSKGAVFKLDAFGNGATIHNFGDGTVANDGSYPTTGLVQGPDGNYYGLANGGSAGGGVVFRINSYGAYDIIHNFGDGSTPSDGNGPQGSLIVGTDGNFYGVTYGGGTGTVGTIFRMTPAGAVTVLHSFGDGSTVNDGFFPTASSLVQATDGNFYGTTYYGGDPAANKGAVFQMTPTGVVKTIYSFPDPSKSPNGAAPQSGLIQGFDGNLYGTTSTGGDATVNGGTIFQVTPKGAFKLLHKFTTYVVNQILDGSVPQAALLQGPDGNFYGTTTNGGIGGGTVFTIIADQVPTFAPVVSGPTTTSLALHRAVNFRLSAIGATSWSASGLPAGLGIDSATGVVTGVPAVTAAKTYNATISATNAIGTTDVKVAFNLVTYPGLTNTAYPPAQKVGTIFTYQMMVTGFPTLYEASGLPAGTALDSLTGLITGKLTAAGSYTLHLSAQNAAGVTANLAVPFTVTK